MIEPLALLFIGAGAVAGLGFAINFFWQTGLVAAFKYALFILAVIIIFAASGLWLTSNKYAWGILTPVFALMLLGGWVVIKFGPRIISFVMKKIKSLQNRK